MLSNPQHYVYVMNELYAIQSTVLILHTFSCTSTNLYLNGDLGTQTCQLHHLGTLWVGY